MLLTLTLGISPHGFLHGTGIFEGVIESQFSLPLDSKPMKKQYARLKDSMNGVLAEKAGLKTWLGSNANRRVFLPPGLKLCTGPRAGNSGAVARRTHGRAGQRVEGVGRRMGGTQHNPLHALSPFSQGGQERRVPAFWGGVLYSVGIGRNGAHKLPSQQIAEDKEKGSSNLGGGLERLGAPENESQSGPLNHPHHLHLSAAPGLLFLHQEAD